MNPLHPLIAMSGGVDSAVAAHLIRQACPHCSGAIMRLYETEATAGSIRDAEAVAARLGIPFHVLELGKDFQAHVIEPFIRCYERGDTPNPCIECNRHLKFDAFWQQAKALGCDAIVTGHYARIRKDEATGRYLLYKATDAAKDQSYVLYSLTQEQLAHTLLPLGELTKEQVRQIASEQGFANAHKQDSQDICFIPDGDYVNFIKKYTGKAYAPGDFLDLAGNPVGKHSGALSYTLGQRKGLGLAMGAPVYVCAKDMAANTVTIGPNEALYKSVLRAQDCNFIPFSAPTAPMRITAKARYRHTEQPATLYPDGSGIRVEFDQPQRALTPGQAVVLYDGDLVIGGGTITEVL